MGPGLFGSFTSGSPAWPPLLSLSASPSGVVGELVSPRPLSPRPLRREHFDSAPRREHYSASLNRIVLTGRNPKIGICQCHLESRFTRHRRSSPSRRKCGIIAGNRRLRIRIAIRRCGGPSGSLQRDRPRTSLGTRRSFRSVSSLGSVGSPSHLGPLSWLPPESVLGLSPDADSSPMWLRSRPSRPPCERSG